MNKLFYAYALAEPCGAVKLIIYFIYVTGMRVIKI
jgi:hypothetical protein